MGPLFPLQNLPTGARQATWCVRPLVELRVIAGTGVALGVLVLERIILFCVLTRSGLVYLMGEEMEAQQGDEDLSSLLFLLLEKVCRNTLV